MNCLPFTEYQLVMALNRLEVLLSKTYDEVECQRIMNKMKWIAYELSKIEGEKPNLQQSKVDKCESDNNYKLEKEVIVEGIPSYLIPLQPRHQNEITLHRNQIFTQEQLEKYYNGEDGSQHYIAVDGLVFDVTEFPQWSDEETEDILDDNRLPEHLQIKQSDKIKRLIKYAKLVGLIV